MDASVHTRGDGEASWHHTNQNLFRKLINMQEFDTGAETVGQNKPEQRRSLDNHLSVFFLIHCHTWTLRGAPIVPKQKGKVGGKKKL